MRAAHGPAPVPRERGHYRDESPCACGGVVRIRIATACDPVPGATTYRCDRCGKDGRYNAATEQPVVSTLQVRPLDLICARPGCGKTFRRKPRSVRRHCSSACRLSHIWEDGEERECGCGCGETFRLNPSGTGSERRYFSQRCAMRAAYQREKARARASA